MNQLHRLETTVDIDEDDSSTSRLTLRCRLEAVTSDGHRILLLDDRGWTATGPDNIRHYLTPADITNTARAVVGPDKPRPGHTHAEAADQYWTDLADTASRHNHAPNPTSADLQHLPHTIRISPNLQAQLDEPTEKTPTEKG